MKNLKPNSVNYKYFFVSELTSFFYFISIKFSMLKYKDNISCINTHNHSIV